ncbi:MAG: tetratricopeptide repeat protein [Nitrospirae bacterium]|nr:tetratricopeptide repeat protein [Nitrospirota bacterium]
MYRKVLSVIILYAVAGLLIYSNVIVNGIFLFDDFEYVVGNIIIQSFSYLPLSDPRYVGYLSFAVNYAIGGENPVGYHLVNVIIHIINAFLVFLLIRLILDIVSSRRDNSQPNLYVEPPPSPSPLEGQGWVGGIFGSVHTAMAFFIGLIFLVHPVQTQAVSYITQRFTSLCALFYVLSILLYLTSRVRLEKTPVGSGAYVLYGLSILSNVLAMKTKEIAFTIPFTIAVFELLLFKSSIYTKRRFIYLIPYMASLVIIPLSLLGPDWGLIGHGEGVDEVVRRDKLYDLSERSAYEYFLTQLRVIVTYIKLVFWPVGLRVVYDFRASHSFFELKVILSGLSLLAIGGYALFLWKKASNAKPDDAAEYKLMSIGIIWFFIMLSIESSVIPIKDLIFEHRVYLPSMGLIASSFLLLIRIVRKIRTSGSDLIKVGTFTLIIALPLAIGSYIRNEVWTDELKFWDDVVKKVPDKAIGYNNRGNAYGKLGQIGLALRDMDKTISYFPESQKDIMAWKYADFTAANMSKTYMNRGQMYYMLGDIERANADFDRSKRVFFMVGKGADLKTADLYSSRGKYMHAVEEYIRLLEWDPDNIDALNNRGNTYSKMNLYNEAIRDFNKVISLKPDFLPAYYNRAVAYSWSNNRERALSDLKTACSMGFGPACEDINELQKGK